MCKLWRDSHGKWSFTALDERRTGDADDDDEIWEVVRKLNEKKETGNALYSYDESDGE